MEGEDEEEGEEEGEEKGRPDGTRTPISLPSGSKKSEDVSLLDEGCNATVRPIIKASVATATTTKIETRRRDHERMLFLSGMVSGVRFLGVCT